MSIQMTTIEIDQSTAAILQALKAEAKAQGKTLAALLSPLLPVKNGAHPSNEIATLEEKQEERPFYETATPEEWIRELNAWAASHDPNTPVILDDSREAIYGDDGR
ncbi:MAG: hypothetical protein M3X11_25405 [Acidobacteriota bacterium]|nr:hypothetical protein [Acidobacteriota bacterium]